MASTIAVDTAPAPATEAGLPAGHLPRCRAFGVDQAAVGPFHLLGPDRGRLPRHRARRPDQRRLGPPLRHRSQGCARTGIPPTAAFSSLAIAQLAFAILGVMVVTGEYSTGMIRTSLAAVPKRYRFLGAKVLVWAAVALVAGEIISFVTFLVGQALIPGTRRRPRSAGHDVLRAVVGAGLYLAVLGVLGSALGVLLRHAAAAIGSIVAILLVLARLSRPPCRSSWSNPIERWWPTNAGQQVAVIVRDAHTLPAWAGFGVMAAFTAIVLVAAFVVLERRDA